jgi:cytochrome c biogenesis protein CcmG/thiol:disulfide interchange protein DsbE
MWIKGMLGVALVLLAPIALGATAGPAVGQPAPNFLGRTLDDNSYRLKSDTGKPKVINFFSLTCKPCRQEMPELGKLEKQYPGVKFISVNTNDEQREVVEKFVKSLPAAPSNIVLTSGGLQETFHLLGLPHTIVLDSDNVVLMNLVGYTPDNIKRLNKALQEIAQR